MADTLAQFDKIISDSKSVFLQKNQDYGSSWRILRSTSLTDQLYIKAMRIRTIEQEGSNLVGDDIQDDYKGLINYSIMALIQMANPFESDAELNTSSSQLEQWYDQQSTTIRELLIKKNHDYGEVWREMRISSMTDLILVKLLRIKQIEENDGQTIISEGIDANYQDIVNYSVFALIKMSEDDTD